MYQRCYQPDNNNGGGGRHLDDEEPPTEEESPAPAPSSSSSHDFFPLGGSCRNDCESNADCQNDRDLVNPCGECGQVHGTEMYHVCYQPEEETPTPAPTHNYFPDGGSCSNSCMSDSDCQYGGYNPCGKCGKYEGTEMYQRCYQPEDDDDDHVDYDDDWRRHRHHDDDWRRYRDHDEHYDDRHRDHDGGRSLLRGGSM
jgi:hypothetical protein